jgi:mannose/cellobiose epimerase-like protein (N-acyl-D-glucosamine 2-epimerase family)
VINRCFADGRPDDIDARLWPQTERIRASCMAAERSRDSIHVLHAVEATQTVMRYLDTPVRGLWRDRLNARDVFVQEPAPASSLYHIVGAAIALQRLCNLQ